MTRLAFGVKCGALTARGLLEVLAVAAEGEAGAAHKGFGKG
jgi:hypothetical protein